MKHDFEDVVKCPYCDKKQDSSEGFSDHDFETRCEHCAKVFYVEPYLKREYSTEGACRKNGELPHALLQIYAWIKPKKGEESYRCRKCFREYYSWQLPGGKYPKLKEGEFEIVAADPDRPDEIL